MRSRSACPAPLGDGYFFTFFADLSGAIVVRLAIGCCLQTYYFAINRKRKFRERDAWQPAGGPGWWWRERSGQNGAFRAVLSERIWSGQRASRAHTQRPPSQL